MSTAEATYLSVAETARALNLSEATVYRRVWDGSLPILRLSEQGAIRIPVAALEELATYRGESFARAPRTGPSPAVEASAHGGGSERGRDEP